MTKTEKQLREARRLLSRAWPHLTPARQGLAEEIVAFLKGDDADHTCVGMGTTDILEDQGRWDRKLPPYGEH